MIEGFNHSGTEHKCNVCQCDFDDDEGGVQGYLGILPVAFCPTCFAGLCDMVEQLNARDWEGLTDEEIEHAYINTNNFERMARVLEDRLKEKNYDDYQ